MAFYTEHTVKLLDGVELFYTDSGPPDSADYTTLIVLHGTAFNGDSMIPLHEHSHANNFRIVIWNRRDYRGSTKYTDEELEDLKAGRKIFQERLVLQIASFFEHLIKHENTPKLSHDRKAGGFILMGWSFGNATTLALLSDPAVIPASLYDIIEPYLMSVVLYDPPYTALGYTLPGQETVYNPWTDPDYPTPEQVYDNFQHWVSSYYTHPDIASGKLSGMSFEKRTAKRTVNSWTEDEKERYFDKVAAARSDLPAYAPQMQATLRTQTHNALFEEALATTYFPQAKIFYISGRQTCYLCMWAYMESSRMYKEAVSSGKKTRWLTFELVEGNHFLHYDNPDLLLRGVARGCKGD